MASELEIYNGALIAMGEEPLINLTPATEVGRILSALFPTQRDATIRAHPWNFALVRTTLADTGAAPPFGYGKAYHLPADPFCLRVYELEEPGMKYTVEGRTLLTDEGPPLYARLIVRVTNPALFDALCADAMSLRLAWRACYRITQSRTLQADLWQQYVAILREARGVDGQEGFPEEIEASEFLDSRL